MRSVDDDRPPPLFQAPPTGFVHGAARFGTHADACAAAVYDQITADADPVAALAGDPGRQAVAFGLGLRCGGPVTPAVAYAAVRSARAAVLEAELLRVAAAPGADVPEVAVVPVGKRLPDGGGAFGWADVLFADRPAVRVELYPAARRLATCDDGGGVAMAVRAARGGLLARLRTWWTWR